MTLCRAKDGEDWVVDSTHLTKQHFAVPDNWDDLTYNERTEWDRQFDDAVAPGAAEDAGA